ILAALYLSVFLVALDRTILGPAIPAITDEFQSMGDIGWYGSAYMTTSCGFVLLYGRVYALFPAKPAFLAGILLFEAGSALCGAARASWMLILGRALAGLGSSGIFTGAILILAETVPLRRRPMLQGLFGACFGVASAAGPLLGGLLAQSRATWRWCFYLNLPLGGLAAAAVLVSLRPGRSRLTGSWARAVRQLDPLGTLLLLAAIVCLLLALEGGGAGDPRGIVLWVLFGAFAAAFVEWQYRTQDTTATLPDRILFQRSVALGALSQFCVGAAMLTASLYIPLWFQAVRGASAAESGLRTLPLVLAVVVGSVASGVLVQRVGYYTPFMAAGSCLMAVGAGLLTMWDRRTAAPTWIGGQALLGLGVGSAMQHPNLAAQTVLPGPDVPTATALLSLSQTLGGAVFASVGQSVFLGRLAAALAGVGGLDVARLVASGATDLTRTVPEALRPHVLDAYNTSLALGPFLAVLVVACLAVPCALGMEFRSIKEGYEEKPAVSGEKAPD
ncbi:MFS general substrate transporter, partial [Thozetella sp. PMI_491]